MSSKAARYNKRITAGESVTAVEEHVTAADVMRDMALYYVNLVAKKPLAARPFWNGFRNSKDDYPALPEGTSTERKTQIIEARQEYAAAADDREWNVALAIGQRYGVTLSEVPAR